MANNPAGLPELSVMADYFCDCDYPYFNELREGMKLLRHTGCRITEIFEIDRWQIISNYSVRLQPQKMNNYRYIELNSDFDNFIAAIQGQYKPFLSRTYSQLQNLFSIINKWGTVKSGDKDITLYIFRYLYLRNLQDLGLTLAEIASIMGYTTTAVISNYLDAVIMTDVPVKSAEIWGTPIVEVTNPITGRTWMDRNLGASRVALSSTDSEAFGDLFQYGRVADGHELRTSGTTTILSSTDVPGHGNFILASSIPYDWRNPQNMNLWQGVIADGWRLPTIDEFETERKSWSSSDAAGAFASPLKLALGGYRYHGDGSFYGVGTFARIWASDPWDYYSRFIYVANNIAYMSQFTRASGNSVRLIKDV
jgi:hypothetical protein